MIISRQNKQYSKKIHIVLQNIFFRELNDPVFKRVGINYLKLNQKKTHATVYLDVENIENNEQVFEKLKKLTIFLRKKVAEELQVFKTPNFSFVKDTVFQRALNLEKLIDEAVKTNA